MNEERNRSHVQTLHPGCRNVFPLQRISLAVDKVILCIAYLPKERLLAHKKRDNDAENR